MAILTVKDKRIKQLLKCARELQKQHQLLQTKTKKYQEYANLARTQGTLTPQQKNEFDQMSCTVIDFGDPMNNLIQALKPLKNIKDDLC